MGAIPEFEAGFLEQAIAGAGLRGPAGEHLVELVRRRLDKGAVEYGPRNYLTDDCLGQLTEEPTDVLGWSLLAALQLYLQEAHGELEAELADDHRAELLAIATDGAALWRRCEALRQQLAAERGDGGARKMRSRSAPSGAVSSENGR